MAFCRGNASLFLFAICIISISSGASLLENGVSGRGGHRFVPFRRLDAMSPTAISMDLVSNSTFVLAAERTERRDPLNDFRKYTGGWNISNRHYWASVGYSAAPLFGIALAWFVIFGLILIISACCYCCCRRPVHSYSVSAYAISLILLIIFTIAVIVGCAVLYYGQEKFHNSTSDTLNYVVDQAVFTVDNLRDFSGNLSAAKGLKVASLLIPGDLQGKIVEIATKVNSSADNLDTQTSKNSKNIRDVLNTVRLVLIIIAAVMLLLALLGFGFSILGLQFLVYVLVLIGWFLVTAMFILSGVFLLLHNAVGDTCLAMDEWVAHPTEHTALDSILPCVDVATANESLYRSKEVTYKVADIVNNVINGVCNPSNPSIRYNQSGPLMPTLCNPFNQDLTNRTCAPGEVVLSNASQVWKNYECNATAVNGLEICTTVGRVTPSIYNEMNAAVTVGYALHHYGPYLVGLEDCTFARQTFIAINRNNCPGLRRYTDWVFSGLSLVSAAVMLSAVFWVVYARERRHRVYSRKHNLHEGRAPLPDKP